ncbi:MAG: hypothetical protein ABIG11_02005 [bacterium]
MRQNREHPHPAFLANQAESMLWADAYSAGRPPVIWKDIWIHPPGKSKRFLAAAGLEIQSCGLHPAPYVSGDESMLSAGVYSAGRPP